MEKAYIKIPSQYRQKIVTKALEELISSPDIMIMGLQSRNDSEAYAYSQGIGG